MADISGGPLQSSSSSLRKPRKSNFSTDEIDMLVSMVKKHYKTLYGKFAKRASNKNTRQKAWLDILRKVNGVSIERRTLQEVKNKWKKCQSILKENGTYSLLSSGNNDDDPDSMPLMERLLKPNEIAQSQSTQQPLQQPPPLQQKAQILKSQSLSPTKLKVTRQGPKIRTPTDQSPRLHPPAPPPPAEVTPVNEEMCLRWNSHHSNMQQAFPNILNKEQYVDCTLAAEGKTLKCHRMILSSCSPYFEEILSNISPLQHPVLFMKDIPFWILKSLCDFMYAGEVHIYQNRLQELLTVAEMLKIKGLAGKTSNDQESRDNNRGNNDNHGNIKEERRQKKFNYHQHQQQSQQQQQQQQFRTGRLINIPPLSRRNDYDNDDVLDPLDLLEPLYEEIADEKKPATTITPATTSAIPTTTTTPNLLPKLQKYQQQFFKKQLPKRMKKRKFSEDRDPSPPPVFSFRKGTRSRPNVKIPKYYHSDYANSKPSTSSQSQQPPPPLPPPVPPQQSDPLLDVDDIKTEPIDVEDNNLSDYNDDTTSTTTTTTQLPQSSGILPETLPSCIEISPQFNNNHNNNNDKFRKIKLTKPIISNVHSIDDHHNNNDNNNNNNNDVDEDDDDDLHTPLGGLEVIKITMEGNQERINLAVNDLNDVINDIDDDEDDDIDDNDGDDENSKTPPQLTTQSQINNDDDHDNNDTIDMDLEPVQQLENCDNEEISQQQQLETNDNDHNHTIEENYEIKDVSDHDQAIEENYEIKNHNHDVENENDTKTDEIIEESPIIHDNVTDVITEQSHNDNDVIDHIIDDINDQTNNNNDDDDA